MTLTLIITLALLVIAAFVGNHFSKLPKNIWLLFLTQPLAMCTAPTIVLCGGILGAQLAPDPEMATLPITMTILGTASAVVPASMLMQRIGRRIGTMIGFSIAIVGSLFATAAAMYSMFWLLILGCVFMGFSLAFVAQLRFAALESLEDDSLNPKAISVLMTSGLFAAILGPEIAVNSAQMIDSPHGFAGSFFSLTILLTAAIILISRLDGMVSAKVEEEVDTRSLGTLVKQPIFLIALASAAIGYAVMSYVMTASPLSMHEFQGFDLDSVKWVVQSHILAMYAPSLVAAYLVKKIGLNKLMVIGSGLYCIVVMVAVSGHSIMHYWWAMVMLGIGWNFLFTSGTLLLPKAYNQNERFKAQAVNDFVVFFSQALASLLAGIILFSQGWLTLIYIVIPMIVLMLIMSGWYFVINKRQLTNIEQI